MADNVADDELKPTQTEGYKVGELKSVEEYARLDAEDESLARWKASLGIAPGSSTSADPSKPKLEIHALSLESSSAPGGKISIELGQMSAARTEEIRKHPINIKEGVEYNVSLSFSVNQVLLSGLRYIHVVKRSGLTVDKLEEMIGSFGPRGEPYTKRFATEEAPSGMLARSGLYTVRSRVLDDDGNVYADWTWTFKIAKEW